MQIFHRDIPEAGVQYILNRKVNKKPVGKGLEVSAEKEVQGNDVNQL